MNVTITLVNPGADTGPFNIYTNDDNYVVPVATNVAKSALVAGYNVWVPPLAITIKVESTGNCTSAIFLPVVQPTTTSTSTTTSTTTQAPQTTTTTTTYNGPSTTSTTTTILRYNIRIQPVLDNLTCELGAPDATWWSFTSIGTGYYTINGGTTKYYIETLGSGTYDINNQIVTKVATTCTVAQYYYYLADEYYCDTCVPVNTGVLVKASVSTLAPNRFYASFDVSNYVYKITDTGQAPGAAYQINTTDYGSCAAMPGCGTVTTTTPLPTLNAISAGYGTTDTDACSAQPGVFYSYDTTFTGSQRFYSDINGINVAADGFYSAPVPPIGAQKVREQYLGDLGSIAPCP
jgi:hypothetical protein